MAVDLPALFLETIFLEVFNEPPLFSLGPLKIFAVAMNNYYVFTSGKDRACDH
jgi:hypothetical protein